MGGVTSMIEIRGAGSMNDTIQPVQGFSVGQDVKEALSLEKTAFEDASGWNAVSRGQVTGESGRAIIASREQLERVFSPAVNALAMAYTDWAKVTLAGMAWGYDVPRALGAVGCRICALPPRGAAWGEVYRCRKILSTGVERLLTNDHDPAGLEHQHLAAGVVPELRGTGGVGDASHILGRAPTASAHQVCGHAHRYRALLNARGFAELGARLGFGGGPLARLGLRGCVAAIFGVGCCAQCQVLDARVSLGEVDALQEFVGVLQRGCQMVCAH